MKKYFCFLLVAIFLFSSFILVDEALAAKKKGGTKAAKTLQPVSNSGEATLYGSVLNPSDDTVNILTSKVIDEIARIFSDLEGNAGVKVIVFTSAGANAFIAGADIKEIAQIQSRDQGEKLALSGQSVLNRIENSGITVGFDLSQRRN